MASQMTAQLSYTTPEGVHRHRFCAGPIQSLGQDLNHQGSDVQFRRCLRFHAATSRICKSRPVILNGITGGAYGAQERTLVLVGWLAWQVAGRVMAHLSDAISEEAQAGTLSRCA